MDLNFQCIDLVSIIIPVFNAENYLEKSIQSALNQTWPLKEIIVVDDGSSDGSRMIAEKFTDSIIFISRENGGASAARNKGLKAAKGKYIQFLDADDILDEKKIEFQMLALAGEEEIIALCPTVHFENGTELNQLNLTHEWYSQGSDDPVDFLIKLYGGGLIGKGYGGSIQPNAWLTPRLIIDKIGDWNESLSLDDDGEFFCRVILTAKRIVYSPSSINYYRKFKKEKSLSKLHDKAAYKSALSANKLKAKHLLSNTKRDDAKLALSRLFWENAFTFYPSALELSKKALILAKQLYPLYKPTFYTGTKKKISAILGWKAVKTIEHILNNKNEQRN